MLLSTVGILGGKQISLLGIPSGTNLEAGNVIAVSLRLLLAWLDQPGLSLVFLIHCGSGMLGKAYL